jgi:hypothetical protein
MSRKTKRQKTEYDKARDTYRKYSPRHVVSFETDMDEDQKRNAFSIADDIRMAGNEVIDELIKRYDQMVRTKRYRLLMKDYAWHTEHMRPLKEDSERYMQLDKERKKISSRLQETQKEFGVTWEETRKIMISVYPAYNLNSVFALKKAEDIWQGMEKVLYGNGKMIHFKKRGHLPVIKAKQAERGIPISLDDNGNLLFYMDGVGEFSILSPGNDRFLKDELDMILGYLYDPGAEEKAVRHLIETGEVIPVPRPCFAALKCIRIRGRLRVFVQITVASQAAPKKDRAGDPRHVFGNGRIGIDLGSQSCAIYSKNNADLFNLAERSHRSTKCYDKRKKFLLRKMDRSRRAMNPERYNSDGTYKKGSSGKWKKSKHYIRMEKELHELERRNADSRKYAVREDANRIRSYGNVCIIEPPNAKKLQRRAKKTERQEKVSSVKKKDGSVINIRKYKRKKRFGRSVLHRCPGLFQAELKKKFGDGYHEVPNNYRASQYDYETDTYHKKKLSEREHVTGKSGIHLQRDSYSAFLLYCANKTFEKIERDHCISEFTAYHKSHDMMINKIRSSGIPICNSGIATI